MSGYDKNFSDKGFGSVGDIDIDKINEHNNGISSLKQRLKELQDDRDLYKKMMEAAFEGIVIMEDGLISNVNHSMLHMSGYSKDELIGQQVFPFIASNNLEILEAQMANTPVEPLEMEIIKKDGSTLPTEIHCKTLFYGEQKVQVSVFRDISAHLAVRRRLISERELAETASLAKSQFLASMSHEIRTPLNAIIGMSEVLAGTPLTPQQQHFVQTLTSAGKDLISIVNNVLDLSKIEAQHFELEHNGFDLKEVVHQTCKLYQVTAGQKGLQLIERFESGSPVFLLGDSHRVGQILGNLIGNAVKFTEKGKITVTVTVSSHSKKDKTSKLPVYFSVTDTGIGIPKEKLNRIFDRFSQVDTSTARKYGGTGLGLTITAHLVEMMGGEISVESQPGKGSCFSFHLLFDLPPETASAIGESSEELSADGLNQDADVPELPYSGEEPCYSLLLAEDSESNQLVVEALLMHAPVTIDIAPNGESAIEKFKQNTYHLVIMDIQMPIVDGLEATRQIRAWEKEQGLARTPIIAMTAFAMDGDAEKSIQAGCDFHLSKPIKIKRFLETLSRFIKEIKPMTDTVPVGDYHPFVPTDLQKEQIPVYVDPVFMPLVPDFLKGLIDSLRIIRDSMINGDYGKIDVLGHKMKGDGGTYGFDDIGYLGVRLQKAAKEKDNKKIKDIASQLVYYLERLIVMEKNKTKQSLEQSNETSDR